MEVVGSSLSDSTDGALCVHCGNATTKSGFIKDSEAYCCTGCYIARTSILACGLENYYHIRDGLLATTQPSENSQNEFAYLNQNDIRKHYEISENEMEFFVDGIQCAACVWLLEQLARHLDGVDTIRVNAVHKTLRMRYEPMADLNKVLNEIASFGYPLRPLHHLDDKQNLMESKKMQDLKRLSVAAVCAGNIMLLSFADYFGAEAKFAQVFRLVSFLLILPITFYSAAPILKNAFFTVRKLRFSMDLPISLAFVSGLVLSLFSLALGEDHIYFDSIALLVFLILLSRYFINRVQETYQQKLNQQDGLVPVAVKDSQGLFHLTKHLKIGQVLSLKPGETFPADGYVESGHAWISEAILTGEASKRFVNQGAKVFAGSKIESGDLQMVVEQPFHHSRLGRIIQKANEALLFKKNIGSLEEKWATYFTSVTFLLAMTTFIVFSGQWFLAFERSLALLIVACPCAIAFGSPLIQYQILLQLNKMGIYLKSADVLSKISSITDIFFDKTGTLTTGNFHVLDFQLPKSELTAILSLEKQSQHPVARAIVNHCNDHHIVEKVEDFEVIPARGVRAKIGGHVYEALSRQIESKDLYIDFFKDQNKIGHIQLQDSLQPGIDLLVQSLATNHRLHIVSGDRNSIVKTVANALGIPFWQGAMSPEQKEERINQVPAAMMVGDGINDTTALAAANIGIVVGGSIEKALSVADIFVASDQLPHLTKLWLAAKSNHRIHKRIFLFSILYNSLAASLAFLGFIKPVFAAILMPISTLSILLIVLFSFRGGLWKFST
tara:strand:- start:9179 stop:11524 length:2346 start_codon:yes stop_codon:yes gene_type:complete